MKACNSASDAVWDIYQGALNDYLKAGRECGWLSLETTFKRDHAKLVLERFYALQREWN